MPDYSTANTVYISAIDQVVAARGGRRREIVGIVVAHRENTPYGTIRRTVHYTGSAVSGQNLGTATSTPRLPTARRNIWRDNGC